ncbi:MAG: hypothetical protein M0032_04500, partial [Actinomycetota bacterium]|nr:hypothetical protein [Actinomycetota bacterium]
MVSAPGSRLLRRAASYDGWGPVRGSAADDTEGVVLAAGRRTVTRSLPAPRRFVPTARGSSAAQGTGGELVPDVRSER